MYEPVEVIKSKNGKYRGEIYYDDICDNPRTMFDHVGVMLYNHRNYILGDEKFDPSEMINYETGDEYEDIDEYLKKERNSVAALPLYIYDHSGVTMSTSRHRCSWDTSFVGCIYITKEAAVENFGENYTEKQLYDCLESEVKEFDDYLTGNVYGFKMIETRVVNETCPHCGEITKTYGDDFETDACWGIYGFEWVSEEVKMHIEAYENRCNNAQNI